MHGQQNIKFNRRTLGSLVAETHRHIYRDNLHFCIYFSYVVHHTETNKIKSCILSLFAFPL